MMSLLKSDASLVHSILLHNSTYFYIQFYILLVYTFTSTSVGGGTSAQYLRIESILSPKKFKTNIHISELKTTNRKQHFERAPVVPQPD